MALLPILEVEPQLDSRRDVGNELREAERLWWSEGGGGFALLCP